MNKYIIQVITYDEEDDSSATLSRIIEEREEAENRYNAEITAKKENQVVKMYHLTEIKRRI